MGDPFFGERGGFFIVHLRSNNAAIEGTAAMLLAWKVDQTHLLLDSSQRARPLASICATRMASEKLQSNRLEAPGILQALLTVGHRRLNTCSELSASDIHDVPTSLIKCFRVAQAPYVEGTPDVEPARTRHARSSGRQVNPQLARGIPAIVARGSVHSPVFGGGQGRL